MAFTNTGPVTLVAPGQTVTWSYTYGSDKGAQYASADIHGMVGHHGSSAVFLADKQRKMRDANGGVSYLVDITNQGPRWAGHNLQGGGFV